MSAGSLAIGALLHGLGHAALAFAAASCARALVSVDAADASGRALGLALAGLGAISAKIAGGVLLARAAAHATGSLGGALRLRVLDGWLGAVARGRPRHSDHGAHGAAPSDSVVASRSTQALAALTSDVREVELGLGAGVLASVRAAGQLIPLAVLLVWLAPAMSSWALGSLAVFALALGRARGALRGAHRRVAARAEALLQAADDAVRHADVWATFGAGRLVRARVEAQGEAWSRLAASADARSVALSGASELLAAVALVLVIALARFGWLAAEGPRLLPFAVAFFMAYRPLRELGDARAVLSRARVALDRLAPWLAEEPPPEPSSVLGGREVAPIEVRELVLPHGTAAPLSLSLQPGEIVVLRGPTGTGKTTLLRVLLGLQAPTSGTVHHGTVDLTRAPAGPSARPFAWMPQEAPLLPGTLDDNVALGDPERKAGEALASIGASALVDRIGSDALGGDRTLSGGERQWVSLARALATGLPVLLLDEPTSGLDPASQAAVLDAIAALRGKRTVLLVTHRPECEAVADRVIVLG